MKNKKISKIILLSVTIIAIMCLAGMFNSKVQAYDHNAMNALDNTFEKDDILVLPFILSNAKQTITKTFLVSEFNNAGLDVINQSTLPETISTGTVVKTPLVDYTILIYGDVDGNGKITVYDAQRAFDYWAKNAKFSNDIFELAANVYNNDKKITVYDAQTIFDFWMGNSRKLVLNEPIPYVKYVTSMEIIPGNTKVNYKYNENIDLEGVTVNLIWSDGHKEDVTNRVILKTKKATTNKVELTYGQFTGSYSITVTNYITGIDIVTNPTKVNYVEEDTISLAGLAVHTIYADGTTQAINVSSVSLDSSVAEFGKNTITVSYTTNKTIDDSEKTFTDTFNISVIKKFSQFNIQPVSEDIKGTCYDLIDAIELKSGEDEEQITVDYALGYKIYHKANENEEYEEVGRNQAKIVPKVNNDSNKDAQIVLSLKAKLPGTYKIVLESVKEKTNKTGTTDGVIVKVEESTVVNNIKIGENKEYEPNNAIKIGLTIGKESKLPIKFFHDYTDNDFGNRTVQINDVKFDRVQNVTSIYKFYHTNTGDSTILIENNADGSIDKIGIKPTVGNKDDTVLTITVDDRAFVFNIEVAFPRLEIAEKIKFGTEPNVTYNGESYTLLSIIVRDINDEVISLSKEDFESDITITYNNQDCHPGFHIDAEYFYYDKNHYLHVSGQEMPVQYIGLANVSLTYTLEQLAQHPIVITYNGKTYPIEIDTSV